MKSLFLRVYFAGIKTNQVYKENKVQGVESIIRF